MISKKSNNSEFGKPLSLIGLPDFQFYSSFDYVRNYILQMKLESALYYLKSCPDHVVKSLIPCFETIIKNEFQSQMKLLFLALFAKLKCDPTILKYLLDLEMKPETRDFLIHLFEISPKFCDNLQYLII